MKKACLIVILFTALLFSVSAQTENYLFEVFTTKDGGFIPEGRPASTIREFSLLERVYKEKVCNIFYTRGNLIPVRTKGELLVNNGNTRIRSDDPIPRLLKDFMRSHVGGLGVLGQYELSLYEERCFWIVFPCIFNGEKMTLNIYAHYYNNMPVGGSSFLDGEIKWAAFKGVVPEEVFNDPFEYR